MAIFIASTKSISRGKGQSAVASASYRAGVELEDNRYGRTHDYSKRSGVMSADIILPKALTAANAEISRSDLWNKAEAAEKRKDARVAREWLVNLPYELSAEDRKELAHTFAQTLADRYGTIADCAIHKPTDKEVARGADPRNFHAHILFTTRCAELDDNNEIILTDKATIELSDNKRRSLGMERVSHEIKKVRQIWEQIANDKLFEHNHQLIDSRSYADQGIDITPQLKMGAVATKRERNKYEQELKRAEKAKEQGGHYRIDQTPASQRGIINEIIRERNELVWSAELTKNQRINERADQTIETARENRLFTAPKAPKPNFKPSKVTDDELEQAKLVAERVRHARIERQKALKAAEVLEQQRQAQRQRIAAEKKEQEQLIQQKMAHQRQLNDQKQRFDRHQARLSQLRLWQDNPLISGAEPNSVFRHDLTELLRCDQHMDHWKHFLNDPDTTDYQKQLTEAQLRGIGQKIVTDSTSILSHIQTINDPSRQHEHLKTFGRVFEHIKNNHNSVCSANDQQQLQALSHKIYEAERSLSRELNSSKSYGMSPRF